MVQLFGMLPYNRFVKLRLGVGGVPVLDGVVNPLHEAGHVGVDA